jgi:PAS domain S-box-containing protein
LNAKTWPINTASAQQFDDEDLRQNVLRSFDFADLTDDPELERIAQFAAKLCDAPSAMVNVVEKAGQTMLGKVGKTPGLDVDQTENLCAFSMRSDGFTQITDTHDYAEYAQFSVVTGPPFVRFYAGIPLVSSEGAPLGMVCVTDTAPRPEGLNGLQREGLQVMASAALRRIETHREANQATVELENNARQLRFMLDSVPDIAWSADPGPVFTHFNARWREATGKEPPRTTADFANFIHPEDYQGALAGISEAMRLVRPHEYQWRLRQADGSYRWILSRAMPSTDAPETARWFGTITDIDDAHRLAEQSELLSQELSHRIKNIFAVISGVISIRSRGHGGEVQGFTEEVTDVIAALGTAHDYVRPEGGREAGSIKQLARDLLAPYEDHPGVRIKVAGDDFELAPDAATPLAMVLHELATNAAKYGALSDSNGSDSNGSGTDGEVHLTITQDKAIIDKQANEPAAKDKGTAEPVIRIVWQEVTERLAGAHSSRPAEPQEGFGSTLLRLSISSQLNGSFTRIFKDGGIAVDMVVPRDKLVAEV